MEMEDYTEFEMPDEHELLFFEHLDKSLFLKIVYTSIALLVILLGICGNFIIIFMKLINFRKRKTFDLLVANIAFGHALFSCIFIVMLIHETTHDVLSIPMCYLRNIASDVAPSHLIISLVVLLILVKMAPNMSEKFEFLSIALIWIYGLIWTVTYVPRMTVIRMKFEGAFHNVCHINFGEGFETKWKIRAAFALTNQLFLPLVIFIAFMAFLMIKKRLEGTQNKNLWIYSIIVSSYYFAISLLIAVPHVLWAFFHIHLVTNVYAHVIYFLLSVILVLNPVVYFYFDKNLLKEIRSYFKKPSRDDRDFNEIIFNGNDRNEV